MTCNPDFLLSVLYGQREVRFYDPSCVAELLEYSRLDDADEVQFAEQAPMQHGQSTVGFRLEPRTLQHTLRLWGQSKATLREKKRRLNNLLAASDDPLTLRYLLMPDHTERRIDVRPASGIDMPSSQKLGQFIQDTGLTFVADDPTFYDPVQQSLTWQIPSVGGMDIPTPIPTPIGASTLNSTQNAVNAGSWMAFPTFLLRGPMRNLVIENVTMGWTISFRSGVHIPAGIIWTLTTGFQRRFLDQNGDSRVADLADGHNWNVWHLAYHKEVGEIEPPTVNEILVSFAGGTTYSRVIMTWYNRYLSLWG